MLKQAKTPFDLKEEAIQSTSRALKAMGHPLRLKILCVIADRELPIMDIVNEVGTTQSNVSQHVEVLRSEGILKSRREGSKILCSVANSDILQLMYSLENTFCKQAS